MLKHGEVVECRDIWPPHYRYAATWDEESETIGLLTWLDRKLVCYCPEGRQVMEDRRDGSPTEPCVHERLYVEFKNGKPEARGLDTPQRFDAGVFCD